MSKILKYLIYIIGILFLLYNSVYFRPLEEVRATAEARIFNPKAYAQDFWQNKLMQNLDQAIPLDTLMDKLTTDPATAFDLYSNALGIGNIRFFLVKGRGEAEQIQEDHVLINIDPSNSVKLATDYIFGNAIRDASGQIDINEFVNTMDFNNVSAEINEIVVQSVLPDFIANLQVGDLISFYGAIELNRERTQMNQMEIIPIQLTIQTPDTL